jgi:hypothetical protein
LLDLLVRRALQWAWPLALSRSLDWRRSIGKSVLIRRDAKDVGGIVFAFGEFGIVAMCWHWSSHPGFPASTDTNDDYIAIAWDGANA